MQQQDILFPDESQSNRFDDMPDAEVLLFPHMFKHDEAEHLFATLREETEWKQEKITICGKTMNIPRLTAWYGEPNKTYTYSGIRVESSLWTPTLRKIKSRIEEESDTIFNSVLLNLYCHGSDSVAWHADDERELGKNPAIGSVSLGATRKFQMKHKTDQTQRRDIMLENGSYLLMAGATQHHWLHQIPKTKKPVGERINLTFRNIIDWNEVGDTA